MIDGNKSGGIIPGYTGHIPSKEIQEDLFQNQPVQGRIPGFAGFITGVKSENMFGRTFGKITWESSAELMYRGSDLPADLRYQSNAKDSFISPTKFKQQQQHIKQEAEEKYKRTQLQNLGYQYQDSGNQYDYESNYFNQTTNNGTRLNDLPESVRQEYERYAVLRSDLSYEEALKQAQQQ